MLAASVRPPQNLRGCPTRADTIREDKKVLLGEPVKTSVPHHSLVQKLGQHAKSHLGPAIGARLQPKVQERFDRFSKQNQLRTEYSPSAASIGAQSEVLCWYPLGISINQHNCGRPVARAYCLYLFTCGVASVNPTPHRSCAESNLNPQRISIHAWGEFRVELFGTVISATRERFK